MRKFTPALSTIFTVLLCACSPVLAQTKPIAASATGTIHGSVAGGPTSETVFLDANNNGAIDAGELTTKTSGGNYTFPGVPTGVPLIVRQQLPAGWVQTNPKTPLNTPRYGVHVTLTAGQSLNVNFVDVVTVSTPGVTPPVVVAPPVVIPAGPSTFITGLIPTAAPQSTYTVGMAPAVAWCDARNVGAIRYVGGNPGLGDSFAWDFGNTGHYVYPDPKNPQQTIDLSNAQHGPLAAFVYDAPGSYPIKLTVTKPDGTSRSYAVTAVVASDTRKQYFFSSAGNDGNTGTDAAHPWSAAKFASVANRVSNVRITAVGPTPVTISSAVMLAANVVIDGPFEATMAGGVFAAYTGYTKDVLIRGMTATSAGTTATTTSGGASYTTTTSASNWINARGTGIALVNCSAGTLGEGVSPVTGNIDRGLLVQGFKQLSPTTIAHQVLAYFGGSNVVTLCSTVLSSNIESTIRLESTGGGDGFVFEHNYVSQDISGSRTSAKAPFVTRCAKDLWVGNNVFNQGFVSITSGGASGGERYKTINARYAGNVFTSGKYIALLSIEDGANGLTADGNTFDRSNGPAIQVSPTTDASWPMSDIVISGNVFTGANARLDLLNASAATVRASGAVVPLVAGAVAPKITLSGLVTDRPFTFGAGSVAQPAAVKSLDVTSK